MIVHTLNLERTPEIVLSTIVLNWNRADLLAITLESYLATVSVPYELIVVDNASSDDSEGVIAAFCDGHSHHEAVYLDENLGGEAINRGVDRCRGRYIHVSENDLEYLPGWDQNLIDKLRAFPGLGQLSPFSPFHQADEGEIWSDKPATPWSKDDLTVYVADQGVGTSCVVPREIYQRGARWETKGKNQFRFPRDGRFSKKIKEMGYVVAWNDSYVVRNLGHGIDELKSRLPYYLENYAAKPGRGIDALAQRLVEHGYRLVQDQSSQWTIKPLAVGDEGETAQ